ncbi:Endoglucanase EG-1 [Paramyrothecium foliicola]|nr:Endoglucanase EG-1 [Paramyrothecium foliicola]
MPEWAKRGCRGDILQPSRRAWLELPPKPRHEKEEVKAPGQLQGASPSTYKSSQTELSVRALLGFFLFTDSLNLPLPAFTMSRSLPLVASALLGLVAAQHPGDTPEVHPRLKTWKCTVDDGCEELNSAIVLDGLAHPVYQIDNPSYNCGDWGNAPNATACPDAETCQANCVMDGISDYSKYGITTDGASLTLEQLSSDGSLLSPRVYLLSEDEQSYEMLHLTGQEFTFDVDVSKLPCGMNGALYLSEMLEDGGKSELNTGGAYYGTGYCDAQCYTTPFINGEPNLEGYGSCCGELDIWEANARATHLAPHPCNQTHLYKCEGEECAFEGVCDEHGCGYNPYAVGNPLYYGPKLKIDTTRPFTVVTQFPADDNGILKEYHRLYIQDGKIIRNAPTKREDLPETNFMDDNYCSAAGARRYMELGATKVMGEHMSRGMVLAMSVWWDEGGYMQWLDGGNVGPCNATEGAPSNIRDIQPDAAVTFSNIKWGEIGSTFKGKDCVPRPKA